MSRIAAIELDQSSILRFGPEVQHERDVAVFDLLEENSFQLKEGGPGPYALVLSLRDANLIMDVTCQASGTANEISLPVRSLRRVVKDYFMIVESYFKAIKGAHPSQIESIDMARRGLHDEGAELLAEVLDGRVATDRNTARRLFTLVCVLHIRS